MSRPQICQAKWAVTATIDSRNGHESPAAIPDAAKERFAKRKVPLRRYGDPEEVAHGTLNFVLPASSFINGAVLPVDGGMLAQNHLASLRE